MKTMRVDGGIRFHKGLGGGAPSLCNLVKSLSFLNRMSGGGEDGGHDADPSKNPYESAHVHPSALAVGRGVADPFCHEGRAGRGLAKVPKGGRTEHLRQCSSAW